MNTKDEIQKLINKTDVKIREQELLIHQLEILIAKQLTDQLSPEQHTRALKHLKILYSHKLLDDLYQFRKKIHRKLTRTNEFRQNILNGRWPTRNSKLKSVKLTFSNLRTQGKTLNVLNRFYLGKCQQANQKIFQKTHSDYSFQLYHADIRGGSLVANKLLQESNAAAWALVYSKHLKVNLSSRGMVSVTKEIEGTNVQGSFVFKDRRDILAEGKDAKLYFKVNEEEILVSILALDSFDLLTHLKPKTNSVRYESLSKILFDKGLKAINLNLLDECVPHLWDLQIQMIKE